MGTRIGFAIGLAALTGLGACAQILSLDDYRVAAVDERTDAAAGVDGAATDGAVDVDASSDASLDAGLDAGADGATDASLDGAVDAASDGGGSDARTDGGVTADGAADAGFDAGFDAGVDAGPPVRVRIVEPALNGIANVGTDNLATIMIETTGYTLRAPGSCNGLPDCGHAHVTIDGVNCDNVAAGKAYNIQLSAPGAAKMNMAYCQAGPLGTKTVSVELVADNHRPLTAREVTTTTATFVRGKVRLTSPLDEAVVTVPGNRLVPARFLVSDFTLRAPGQCAGLTNCGHARITVDGANCNAPAQAYNAIASSTAGTDINLASCAGGVFGTKTLQVELVDDTGASLTPAQTSVAEVTFVQ
jgi:hypothetical protein